MDANVDEPVTRISNVAVGKVEICSVELNVELRSTDELIKPVSEELNPVIAEGEEYPV